MSCLLYTSLAECAPSTYMLQMINITGYNGMTFFQPNDIEDLWIRLTGLDPVSVEEMTEHGPVSYTHLDVYKRQVYKQSMADRFIAPCAEHLFGTDQFGRDLFARIIYGGRISLLAGLVVVAIALAIGLSLIHIFLF